MTFRQKTIAIFSLWLTAASLPALAQQRVHGEMPEGAFVIDPAKVANWNDKSFASSEKQFEVKKFESADLERWNHEFPARYASLSDKSFDADTVELKKWDGMKSAKGDVEQRVETKQFEAPSLSSKWAGGQVVNEKWSRGLRKAEEGKKVDTTASDFIVQATIRPLEVPEVQEKLNEYSSPPGERKKDLPSKLQK